MPQVEMLQGPTYLFSRSMSDESTILQAHHIFDNALMHYLLHETNIRHLHASQLCPTAFAPIFRALPYGGKVGCAASWTGMPFLSSLWLHFDVGTAYWNAWTDSADEKAVLTRGIASQSIQTLLYATTTTLEELRLAFTIEGGFNTEYPAYCGSILPEAAFVCLQFLEIQGFADKLARLVDFLQRNRTTLKRVRLTDVQLDRHSIAALFESLAALNNNHATIHGTPKGETQRTIVWYGDAGVSMTLEQEVADWLELCALPVCSRNHGWRE